MVIEEIGYNADGRIRAVIDGKLHSIPDDMTNRDRLRIKREYEDKGGVIPPYVPPAEPTQAELDAAQTAKIEKQGTILYALGKRIFKIERRLAALEGTDPITVAKFREEIEADLY